MIEIEGLSGSWGRREAVTDVCLKIRNGHAYAVVGPRGAGKSTLLDMIAGVLEPMSGTVTVGGYDMATHPREAKRQIGYFSETLSLFAHMTVRECLTFVAEARGTRKSKIERQVEDVLALCRLDGVQNRLMQTLPRADRSRVGIAQALMGNPETILLDDPLAGLSPRMTATTLAILETVHETHTLVIAATDAAPFGALCDCVIRMDGGRVLSVEETIPRVPETDVSGDLTDEEVTD